MVPMPELRRNFGAATIERGMGYAASGRVLTRQIGGAADGSLSVAGTVRGTGRRPYAVRVSISTDGRWLEIDARCSCPVGFDCKHAVALLCAESVDDETVDDEVVDSGPVVADLAASGMVDDETIEDGGDWSAGGPSADHEPAHGRAVGGRAVDSRARWAARTEPPGVVRGRWIPAREPARPAIPAKPSPPPWDRDLGAVLSALEGASGASRDRVPLAIQVEYRSLDPRWAVASCALSIRPLMMGRRGLWIRTGASWRDVHGSMRYAREHDPAQVAALRDLAQAAQHGFSLADPNLVSQGPTLWPVLRRARRSGIEFVPGPGLSRVVIRDDPAEVRVDLRETDGEVTVRIGLWCDDAWWPDATGEIVLIGEPEQPAHGVALLRSTPAPRGGAQRELTLAPLRQPWPTALRSSLSTSQPLVVPAAQWARFEADFLPRLRRQLPVESADGSVQLPEPERPRLRLTVGWAPTPAVSTSWQWVYGRGAGERAFALDASAAPGAARAADLRDPAAERTVLAGLAEPGSGLPEPVREVLFGAGGEPLTSRTWRDRDLLRFVETVMPQLRVVAADGRFELVEAGRQLEFRAALDAPEIRFTTGGTAGDPGGADRGGRGAGGSVSGEPGADEEGAARDWLDLAVLITVDGESVPLAAVLTALTLGDELIFTESGRHVPVAHPAFAQLAELVADASQLVDQPGDRLRVGRYDLALWAELEALGVVDAQARDWARAARALRDFEGLPRVAPTGLRSTPRPYQTDGIRWLAFLWQSGLGGILADDMGLGKTLQTLALIAHARERGADPFLVVAPTSVIGTWVAETAAHTPGLRVAAVTALAARREQSLARACAGADIVVTSYTLFRLEAEQYRALAWGGLILDEAQAVKNHQGKTYQEIRRLDAPFRLALTGTPFENRLLELWSLLSIVAPGLYPWPKRFTEQVVRPIEQQGDQLALDRFRRRIRPFLLRRTKELVAADLPPKQEQVVEIVLNPRHRRIYDTHLQRERQTVLGLVEDFQRNRIAIFGALTRLRQLALDPALVDAKHEAVGSAKLDALVERLRELAAEGHRALVFSQFTSYLRRVRDRLDREGIATVYLDGRTRDRRAVIAEFKSGAQPAFLISLKAGGSGLNLTEADYVFVLDPWWNPAVEVQAIDRAHRIGQQRPVLAYRFVAVGTIEDKVMALKATKAALFAEVLDGDGAMGKALDAEDVRALFAE